MQINNILFLLLLFSLLACQNNEKAKEQQDNTPAVELSKSLPGVWENVSLLVTINTVENTDSTAYFEVKEENWSQMLGIKPIRTYYELDNKYRSEYYTAYDSLTDVRRGIWNTFGDTLMLIEPDASYTYEVKILENGLGEFRALLDWDGDGQEDDEYLGVQRLVSRSTQ